MEQGYLQFFIPDWQQCYVQPPCQFNQSDSIKEFYDWQCVSTLVQPEVFSVVQLGWNIE